MKFKKVLAAAFATLTLSSMAGAAMAHPYDHGYRGGWGGGYNRGWGNHYRGGWGGGRGYNRGWGGYGYRRSAWRAPRNVYYSRRGWGGRGYDRGWGGRRSGW